MKKQSTITTQKIVLTGLLAALTAAGSAMRFTIPLDIGGTTSFHLGNIICALAGLLLGPWYGGLAAGLGSAIYDCLNPLYISEAWITFLTKGALGMVAGLVAITGNKNMGYFKAAIASTAGAISYAVLYLAKSYFYSSLLLHGLTPDAALIALVGKLPATIFNAVVAIICAPILGIAIRNALIRSNIALPQAEKVPSKVLRRSIAAALCLIAILLFFRSYDAVNSQKYQDYQVHYEESLQAAQSIADTEQADGTSAEDYQMMAEKDRTSIKDLQTKSMVYGIGCVALLAGAAILVFKKEKV